MMTVDQLYDEAMKLPAADREALMDRLHLSLLPEEPGEDISPDEWEAVWHEEIVRRSDELHNGQVETMDAYEGIEQLRRELYEEHKRRRS